MIETDKKAFLSVLYPLGEIYEMDMSNKNILKIWFEALSDYSIEEVAEGVTAYIKNPDTGSYKPKPADIIRMIDGTSADKAMVAWTMVENAVRRIGTYRTVVFEDPIIHRVIEDMGGWCSLGEKQESELPFVQKEFLTRYRAVVQRRSLTSYPGKLLGIIEAGNNVEGYYTEDNPVLIGDAGKARLVLEHKAPVHKQPMFTTQLLN